MTFIFSGSFWPRGVSFFGVTPEAALLLSPAAVALPLSLALYAKWYTTFTFLVYFLLVIPWGFRSPDVPHVTSFLVLLSGFSGPQSSASGAWGQLSHPPGVCSVLFLVHFVHSALPVALPPLVSPFNAAQALSSQQWNLATPSSYLAHLGEIRGCLLSGVFSDCMGAEDWSPN